MRGREIRPTDSVRLGAHTTDCQEAQLARKTVLVCDKCGSEIEDSKGATLRLTFADARRGAKEADLCESCAGEVPGRAVARRGRRPKAAA